MSMLIKKFNDSFQKEPTYIAECGGRFEILGNHTDHNHGLCLAATCDLTIKAAVRKEDGTFVKILSEGYKPVEVDLSDLDPKENEKASSSGLIRGIAQYLKDGGYQIGGFSATLTSTIFPGAGVSSSAAFELLIAQIFNVLYNDARIDRILLCKSGQYSENNYFGKKSGLLDQIGVGFGNISSIDFKDIAHPIVEEVKFPFKDLHFILVNTGGSHAELNDLYSAVPENMLSAASKLGHSFLIEGSLEELEQNRNKLTDIEYSRAYHFYNENIRVAKAKEALEKGDKALFLKQINDSCYSSTHYLKNMMVEDNYVGSPAEACDYAFKLMDGKGAVKINGGGFAGSIVSVVPDECMEKYVLGMKEKYGENNVIEVGVRSLGPVVEKI